MNTHNVPMAGAQGTLHGRLVFCHVASASRAAGERDEWWRQLKRGRDV